MAKKKRAMLDPFADIRAAQEKREKAIQSLPLKPSGTTNAGFKQLEEAGKKQLVPEAPLTFGRWKSKGNEDSVLTPIMAGITYPLAKAAEFIPESVKKWNSRAGETGGEIVTLIDNPNKTTTGSGLGDATADLYGGIMGFLAPIDGPTSKIKGTKVIGTSGANVGAELWRGAEKGIAAVAPRVPILKNIPDYVGMGAEKIAPKVPGLKNVAGIAPKAKFVAEYTGKVGGATIPWEGTRALVNDREMSPGEMGLAAGANVGMDLALMGLTKGLARHNGGYGRKAPTAEETTTFDDLFGDVKIEPEPTKPEYAPWFNEEAFNQHHNRQANEVQDFYAGGKQEGPFKPAEQPEQFYATDKFGEYSYAAPNKPPLEPLALPEGTGREYSNMPNFDIVGKPHSPNGLSDSPFTDVLDQLAPKVTEQTTPPMESNKAMVDYIHEYFGGKISKNEIRQMDYNDLTDMANGIASERKGNMWDVMKTEGEKAGYDIDQRYRLETDPQYRQQWEQSRKAAGLENEPINFKLKGDTDANQDISSVNRFLKSKFGTKNKIEYAPEAFENPQFQAANKMAEINTGRTVIPYKGTDRVFGVAIKDKIYINKDTPEPFLYVANHEIIHTIEKTSPETWQRLNQIVVDHINDGQGLEKHYRDKGYSEDKLPAEVTADAMAESMLEPSFWQRVRNEAPELLKPILEAIDSIVSNFKGKVGDDMTILPYLKNIEAMRDRLAGEYRGYLEEVKTGKIETTEITDSAAKVGGTTNPDIRYKLGETRSRADDMREMVLAAAKQFPKSMGFTDGFKSAIKKQFPQVADEPQAEAILKYVYDRATELRKGQTTFKGDGQTITLTKADLQAASTKKTPPGEMGDIDTRQHIVSKTQREPIIASEAAKMVYAKAFDDLYRIDELDRFVSKSTGKHLAPEDKAYLLAINSRESTGAARTILEENLVDAKGNIIGPSFKEVLSNIPKSKEQDFRDYLVLRNSISWMEQGKKVYPDKWEMTPEKAMQRLAAYDQQIPELKQAADEYTNWHRDMAKAWLVDTGIITPDAWQAFLTAHPHYTPFQRQMKPIEITPGVGKARRGFANQSNPTKKAEGSERPIVDPIESTIEQIDRYIKTAKHNEVMQAVNRNLEKAPEELAGFAEIVPEKDMDVLNNINAILERDGIDGVINYLEEPFEQMAARKGKANQPLDKPNVVRSFVNGKVVHTKVNDPVLLDALTALSDTGRNAIVESFRTATRLMKVLTTGGNPIFATRNITRDVPMAYVASDTLSKTPVVREAQFAWGMLDALARIVTNEKWHPDKFYREYKAMGGGSHTASVSADRNLLAESKSKVMPGYWRPENNSPIDYVGKAAKAGFQGIERFTSTVEALPRLPEYVRTVKKGGNDYASKLEGLHKSQDVTVNFSRHGDVSKDADAFIPYFNAAMQGIDKIARMFGSDPVGATYRSIVAVTVPTIWLYLQFNKDNPNYHKLPSHIRDNYYCIPYQDGKKFVKIAKPREVGVVFSDLPERALRKWEADDPEAFYQFSEAWINNFVPPVRPIVMPAADVMRNKNFAGIPIVPGYMEGLSPELQYDEKTSAAAKAIGAKLKLSPKHLDYLFRSYTGVIGELGIPAMAEGRGQNAGQRVGEVLSRTFTVDPLYSNDVTNKFYEQKERLDTAAKDYKATGNEGESYNPGEQRHYNRQADRISNIRKEIRRVNADSSLSFKEKEERTKKMQANMLEIAQKAVGDRFSPRANVR